LDRARRRERDRPPVRRDNSRLRADAAWRTALTAALSFSLPIGALDTTLAIVLRPADFTSFEYAALNAAAAVVAGLAGDGLSLRPLWGCARGPLRPHD
jgi:hypothetical protein